MDVKADIDSVTCGAASTATVQRSVSVKEILLRKKFIVSFSLSARRDSRRRPYFPSAEVIAL